MRFINYTDMAEEGSRLGTLQICINNAWGTVCNDEHFGTTDAEVFCEQLEGFNKTGQLKIHTYFSKCVCIANVYADALYSVNFND